MVDGMKILIVDDICDSGETFKTLIKDMNTSVVDDIAWHEQVRFAALLHKNGSHFHTDFKATTVLDESIWWVFPWEKE
jgi:hypoxanthine phosphoribosyltransferase